MGLIFIVVAAGAGKRFGLKKNKLLYEINNRPLIYFTLSKIQNCKLVDRIILIVRKREIPIFEEIVKKYEFTKVEAIIEGGRKRQDSVYNGLQWLDKNCSKKDLFVAIHDGARVNIDSELIESVYKTALRYNSAIPAVFVRDTVKRITKNNFVEQTIPRENLALVQTPQIFKFSLIFNAYKKAYRENFYATDDASIVEYYGRKVKVVDGLVENIKITFKVDLKSLRTNIRVGTGFDVHKLVKDRKLFLGGIEIPFRKGLSGHSDGDVLIHSIIDALLGATGMDDIGILFPDSDEKYKNIRSTKLLKKTISLINKKGFEIENIDSVIVADEPKISKYKERIRKELGKIIGISENRINIKGKRTEGVLFKNAIASYTVALVKF